MRLLGFCSGFERLGVCFLVASESPRGAFCKLDEFVLYPMGIQRQKTDSFAGVLDVEDSQPDCLGAIAPCPPAPCNPHVEEPGMGGPIRRCQKNAL